MENFGPHLMLDLEDCSPCKLSDLQGVFSLLNELPSKIGMTKITQPYCFPYSGLVPDDSGITGAIIIAESHISIHTFEVKQYCFMDVFSCKQFDVDLCKQIIQEYFETDKITSNLVYRGKNFPRG